MDTEEGREGEGKGGINWEVRFDTDTLPRVKQLVGTCYQVQETESVFCDDLDGWDGETQEVGDAYR